MHEAIGVFVGEDLVSESANEAEESPSQNERRRLPGLPHIPVERTFRRHFRSSRHQR